MRPKSPISIALMVNMVITILIAALAAIAAYGAINSAVEKTVKEDISRDIEVMLDRAPERGVIADLAVLTGAIGTRISAEKPDAGGSVYFLANRSGDKIVGNAARLPQLDLGVWTELDGAELGVSRGPILARAVFIEPDHVLLVGRRLTARASLNRWFVPVLISGVIFLGLSSSILLGFLSHRYQTRIKHINAVFHRIETGDLGARIDPSTFDGSSDELAALSSNVNTALAEVERLLRGLESYSQVAAHELNHSISKLRDRLSQLGETEITDQADRLIDLVTHILELAKIEATPGFAMQPLQLREIVQSAIHLYGDSFDEKSISLKCDFSETSADILGSRPLIESALINLLSNALKHAPAHSTVSLIIDQTAHGISLSVEDQGQGAASTDISDLAVLGRNSDGHGFGLRHVEAVAIRHGAHLHLKSLSPGFRATLLFGRQPSI